MSDATMDSEQTGANEEISAATLAGLTEEERAALGLDTPPHEESAVVAEVPDVPEVVAAEVVAEAPAAVVVALPAALAATLEIEVPENLPAVQFVYRDDGQVLPEYEEQFDALDAQYEGGNLPLRDYNRQRDALKAEMTQAKADGQLWVKECETFWKHNPDWQPGGVLYDMLNGEVVRMATAGAKQGLSGLEIIYAAKQRVEKALDMVRGTKTPPVPTPDKAVIPPKPESPRPGLQTLGGLPVAEREAAAGEFAYLDKLDGFELEAAVNDLKRDAGKYQRWINLS